MVIEPGFGPGHLQNWAIRPEGAMQMNFRCLVRLMLIGMAPVVLLGCDPWAEQPVRQLKFSVIIGIDHAFYKGAMRFAELVKERTHGKLIINVYPDAQLAGGNQARELEMVREGKIDFNFASTLIYSNMDPRFFASSLPWLFSNYEEAEAFLNGPKGRSILDLTANYGITGLAYSENGFRQITNSKRAIRTPDDLRGLRIRVPNAMFAPIYKALGAEATTMTWTAVYKALQENTVDGQENPAETIIRYRLYDVQKYITVWNYSYDAFILAVNQKLYQGLDKQTQDILRQAAAEACAYQTQLSRDAALSQTALLREKGMEVTELTPGQIQAFREKMEPVYAEYEKFIGKQLMEAMRTNKQ
jgi:tripartite ATP-independent transporter DctP family solute receptor